MEDMYIFSFTCVHRQKQIIMTNMLQQCNIYYEQLIMSYGIRIHIKTYNSVEVKLCNIHSYAPS